jgi:pentose-5-phosphate-3-epimerase
MIKITPAILTNNIQEFERELNLYSKHFDLIDIDVNVDFDNFEGMTTASIESVQALIENIDTNINFHLMTTKPLYQVTFLERFVNTYKFKYIIHQEVEIDSKIYDLPQEKLGVAVKSESELKDLEFYNKFSEVQLMTIHTGFQGSKFQPEILDRVEVLKKMGFSGIISIDGGVNLDSAKFIKETLLDRVSVGSYFSKSSNLQKDLESLNIALGNKPNALLSS